MVNQHQDATTTIPLFRLVFHLVFTVAIGSAIFVGLEKELKNITWLVSYSNTSSSVLGVGCSAIALMFRRVLESFYPLIPIKRG